MKKSDDMQVVRGEPLFRYLELPEGVNLDRLDRRGRLRQQMDAKVKRFESGTALEGMTKKQQLAFDLLTSAKVREAFDFKSEPDRLRERYGRSLFGNSVLLARRLVERGVRFVQVTTSPGQPWDHHNAIKRDMHKIATEVDQGSAALVKDLASRGLLDSTIVMWAGEFGRLPTTQNGDGRDHNRNAFTIWFAGGGFRKGLVYGETDDFSYNVVKDPVHIHDANATILHCLGIDHKRLSVKFQGLDVRLTGVEDNGPVKGILA